jgi:thiol-disulfide isomerase/thioredoxin
MAVSKKAVVAVVAVLALAVIGAGLIFQAQRDGTGKGSGDALAALATGPMEKLAVQSPPIPAPDQPFQDADGATVRLADFHGQVLVVNLWATWCAPCLTEMPTLAGLARHYADTPGVRVVAISVDVPDARAKAETFLSDHPPLVFYAEPQFQLPFAFGARGGMPQTILIDRQGRVRAVLTGGADWNSREAVALIDALRAET